MEIREITEGVWDAVKAVGGAAGSALGSAINSAAGSERQEPSQASVAKNLAALQKKYGGGASPEVTWQAARNKIDTDPVSTQWINGVVASWPQAAPGVLAKAVEKTAEKTPAEPAKPAVPAEPGPTVTEAAAAPSAVDEEIYIDSFTDWATRNFNNLPTIMSEYDDLKLKLNNKAKEIFANRDQPTGQTTDVKEYLKLALAGNQALSQTNRLWKSQRASALRSSATDKKTNGAGAGVGAGGEARIEVGTDMRTKIETQVRNMDGVSGYSTKNPVIDDFLRELGFDIR